MMWPNTRARSTPVQRAISSTRRKNTFAMEPCPWGVTHSGTGQTELLRLTFVQDSQLDVGRTRLLKTPLVSNLVRAAGSTVKPDRLYAGGKENAASRGGGVPQHPLGRFGVDTDSNGDSRPRRGGAGWIAVASRPVKARTTVRIQRALLRVNFVIGLTSVEWVLSLAGTQQWPRLLRVRWPAAAQLPPRALCTPPSALRRDAGPAHWR